MIRVIEVVYEPAHSGQAEHVLSLVEHLPRDRFELQVIYPAGDAVTARRLAELGVAGAGWPMRRLWNPGASVALYRLIRRPGVAVAHIHGPFAGLWARPAAWLAGAAVVYTPQTIQLRQKRLEPFYQAAERALGRITDRLISVCQADRDRLIEAGWAGPARIAVIPNGIDVAAWAGRRMSQVEARRRLGWPADRLVVLQVGRLNPQKAPGDFVAAAALALQAHPAARFYLAGDGPLRPDVQAQIDAAGLSDNVTILGQRPDVPLLLAAADVVALSSLWEGLPIALLEAGALGRPAVCTAVNGSPEVVADGETGFVVPPGRPAALAAAIGRLLDEPALAAQMGERAAARIAARFDAGAMGRAVAELYRPQETSQGLKTCEVSDPAADAVIAGHMAQVRDAILCCGAGNIACIALTGGFGRGEGGVRRDDAGVPRPVNDYDILVVTRRNGLLGRLWLRRCLKRQEPALTAALGIRADIACKTPRMLRRWPASVEAHEVAVGHKVLWGNGAPLDAIPWRDAAALPASEASRYLFNRGAALLWARRLAGDPTTHWRFILIAIQKARLAWGDALLLLAGRYTARYAERIGRLADLHLPPDLSDLPALYDAALRFKLQPDFAPFPAGDMPALLEETSAIHERVWRWVETRRAAEQTAEAQSTQSWEKGKEHSEEGQVAHSGSLCALCASAVKFDSAFWLDYSRRPEPRLRAAPLSWSARLYHLGLNLWRVRPRNRSGWFEHPEERLARALPLLLFLSDFYLPAGEVAAQLGLRLPAEPALWRAALSDRLIALWHPGAPFVGG
jgi:glycosyltransferase involved in cell wall biosynthesis